MVCGKWVDNFSEASHVCFEGNLDNLFFRDIAIQEIKELTDKTIVIHSGTFQIQRRYKGRQRIKITYGGVFGGSATAWGYPFKDDKTPAASEE